MSVHLFTSPKEQIKRFLEINEAVWKNPAITEAAIRALGDPPDCPTSGKKGLFCACLFFETGDAFKTFKNNWQACVHVHGKDGTEKWGGVMFTPKCVKQRLLAMPRPLGLRWQVAELGRKFKGQSVSDVRRQLETMGMGQEGPLVAALHKNWAVSMDGKSIPYLDMPDLYVAPNADYNFRFAPSLRFNFYRSGCRVALSASRDDHMNYDFSFGSGLLR